MSVASYLFTFRLLFLLLLIMWKATTGLIEQTQATFFGSFRQGQHAAAATTTSRFSQEGADSNTKNDCNHEEKMVARHRESTARHDTVMSEAEHLLHQKRVFDEMSEFFATKQTIPEELLPVYRHLAGQIWDCVGPKNDDDDSTIRILDVACGTGALFSFIMEQDKAQIEENGSDCSRRRRLEITGVDLSPQMVAAARKHAATLVSSSCDTTAIEVVESDILQYNPHAAGGTANNQIFDVIIVNACFGNFWNPTVVLEHLSQNLLAANGSVVISHPLGAAFVARLHDEDALTVPHLLPTSVDEWRALLTTQGGRQAPLLQCTLLDTTFRDSPYYFARLEKDA